MEDKFSKERTGMLSQDGSRESVQKKKPEQSFHWSNRKIASLVMGLIIVYLATVLISNFVTIRRYEKENQLLMEQIAAADAEIEELNAFIENAEDPVFIEKMAREKLKMVRPDETVYFVVK